MSFVPLETLSPSLLCSMEEMHDWFTAFLELHHPPKRHHLFLLQMQDLSSGPPLFQFNSSSNLLLWLFKILFILFVPVLLIFTVFLLKIFLNGLSLLMCLSRRFRKYLPMLMWVSLQNGELNQISLRFLFFPRLFE